MIGQLIQHRALLDTLIENRMQVVPTWNREAYRWYLQLQFIIIYIFTFVNDFLHFIFTL